VSTPDTNFGISNGFGPENPDAETTLEYAFKIADAAQPPVARRGKNIVVCAASEIPIGGKRIVEADGFSIGVFNIDGKFHAIKNVCPHAGAPLCEGHIQTTHRPGAIGEFEPALAGRVLRCPWHGWEFDIVTGKGLYDRNSRVATYKVEVDDDGNIVLLL
jgi:nitrite reductase/ring-hydroxylating ferredoxin subunit